MKKEDSNHKRFWTRLCCFLTAAVFSASLSLTGITASANDALTEGTSNENTYVSSVSGTAGDVIIRPIDEKTEAQRGRNGSGSIVVKGNGATNKDPYSTMIALKSKYPEGMTYTNADKYTAKGNLLKDREMYSYNGLGCHAFALILSDAVYGDMPYRTHKDFSNIKVGDAIRLENDEHTAMIIGIKGDTITLAEANYNSSVHWGRQISRTDTKGWSYIITRGTVDMSELDFGVYPSQCVYIGEPCKPGIDVIWLKEGTDYSISYINNDKVGTATATVTGKGNFTGSKNIQFQIVDTSPGLILEPMAKELTYNGYEQELATAGQAQYGYLTYAISTKEEIPENSAFTTKIPTAINAGAYIVWYRYKYILGTETWMRTEGKWAIIREKTVNNPTVKLSRSAYVYDGKKKEPAVTVMDGKTIIPETEYTVQYIDNVDPGVAGVIINDIDGGNYVVYGSKTYTISEKNSNNPKAKGTKIKDTKSKGNYVVTSSGTKNPTVKFTGSTLKNPKTVTIPAAITYKGVTYKVTAIGANALKGKTKLTKVTLGKNVASIGSMAFYQCTSLKSLTLPANTKKLGKQFAGKCSKLQTLTIKSKKMTKSTIAAGAFTDMRTKVTIKVPAGKSTSYKTLFRSKGLNKKVKVK